VPTPAWRSSGGEGMVSRPRVLVVDDSADFRENVVEVLGACGVDFGLACDGAEALAALARDPLPDVVLLDLWMPQLDGHAVLRALRTDPRLAAVRVIVLTANDLGNEGLGVPFLVKPFAVEDLLSLMATVLLREPSTESLR
jgi:CheY-like chemotaxis protein